MTVFYNRHTSTRVNNFYCVDTNLKVLIVKNINYAHETRYFYKNALKVSVVICGYKLIRISIMLSMVKLYIIIL